MDIQQETLHCMRQNCQRQQVVPTYVWCSTCHKLYNKEMLHEDCDPQVMVTSEADKKAMGIVNSAYSADAHKPNKTTIKALEEALDEC